MRCVERGGVFLSAGFGDAVKGGSLARVKTGADVLGGGSDIFHS